MMRKKLVVQKILHATEGLFATTTDIVLFLSILPLSMIGAHNQYDMTRRVEEVFSIIREDINYHTIKNAIGKLAKAGYITKKSHRNPLDIAITTLGKQRIEAMIPMYHEKRPWDGHLYLVSYDVPAKPKRKRDLLRQYLRRIGAVLLQESLWLTPYNPRDIIDDFVESEDIGGSVLISKLGSDGAIGEEKLEQLIRRIYQLDALNERYADFIDAHSKRKQTEPALSVHIAYLSILKDDPQLPFELLPTNFLGKKAYDVYQSLINHIAY